MLIRTLVVTALLLNPILGAEALAQNASAVVAAATKTMGVEGLNSITYSGSARNGAFGQSKAIGEPLGPNNVTLITTYTRTISFGPAADPTALVSRASGPTQPPAIPGVPAQPAGTLNQNITGQQAAENWAQALNIWTTPWGFLKGAAANNATARQQGNEQVVSFSPANFKSPSGQTYTVTGHINSQNLVTLVETRVENNVVGDLLVQFDYSNYQNMNGLQVPTRIVQRQAGLATFDANITSATRNPTDLSALLTPPPAPARAGGPGPAAGGPPPAPPAIEAQTIAPGVFKITGNYTSLAIDMGDHILVIESGQSDARGTAVMATAKKAIPNKPIRFVVNSHPHFDHAGGLGAAAAEGATILTHRNNEPVLERLLAGPRTLIGDSLAKVANRRTNVFEPIGDRDVRKGSNGKIVEVIHIPNEHSDGMVAVYLPAERIMWTADITVVNPTPVQVGVVKAAVQTFDRLKLDYNTWIPAHPPNPDRALTKADVTAAAGN